MKFPTGLDHVVLLDAMATRTRLESAEVATKHSNELKIIGTALSALYQAATCHRKCHGGPHILEALCGRTYNLGASAYLLIVRGYYDEALNLVRSIGEVSNIISMSVVDKAALREWLASDKKTRLRKFGPAKIRQILKSKGRDLMLADDDWYTRFCESYTHVSPETKPNLHNDAGQPFVGGVYQSDGLGNSIAELATALGVIGLMISKYFELNDLIQELTEILDTVDAQSLTN